MNLFKLKLLIVLSKVVLRAGLEQMFPSSLGVVSSTPQSKCELQLMSISHSWLVFNFKVASATGDLS